MDAQQLLELAKTAQREYKREWRRRNPDKVRKANERYWQKKALEAQKNESEESIDEHC